MSDKLNNLQKKINIKFKNLNYLKKSITHKSYDPLNNYEKLEFLGDRILGFVISKKLIELYPNEKEGVLDKKFNFWSLDEKLQTRFIERLYTALVQLLNRFHDDWTLGNINKEKVHIVRFDTMMTEFEPLLASILEFIQVEPTSELTKQIQITAEEQRRYKSGHKYNLKKFGLTEEKIRRDCEQIYRTFLS